jgi:cell pole-organizing protein PopZ
MEEILASIRRIIADDDPSAAVQMSSPTASESAVAPVRPVTPTLPQSGPSFDPTAVPLREPSKAEIDTMLAHLRGPQPQTLGPQDPAYEMRDEDERPQPAGFARSVDPQPRVTERSPPKETADDDSGLISGAAAAQVGSAFARLAQEAAVPKGPTLEELVSEMLRPMLKAWLDENLPAMVERLVQAEIERVSRKG